MTVQTSWRPQLAPPKEISINLEQNTNGMDKNAKKDSSNKKWSFGRFFRKKKDIGSDSSSDDDRKAGFIDQKPRRKDKKKRGSKVVGAGFDHIVISPRENEFFLPFETIETPDSHRSMGSIDRRSRVERKKTTRLKPNGNSSSEEEAKSHNSSTISRYRSDESLGSGGVINNRKSRSARNERYYKRMTREENGNAPPAHNTQQVGRWKTQPVQLMNYGYNQPTPTYTLKSSTSLNSMQPSQWGYSMRQKPNHSVTGDKRSISYDNHIHLQNVNRKETIKSPPPPPPPRDPQRRLHVPGQNEMRPISYAFDKNLAPVYSMKDRCVSDDKLWGPNGSIYQSPALPRPSSTTQPAPFPRRFITRSERDVTRNQPPTQEYRYIADAIPRSRKPIHIMQQEEPKKVPTVPSPNSAFVSPQIVRTTKSGLPSPMKSASNFWKKIDQQESVRRGREPEIVHSKIEKPRSISSSRVGEGMGHRKLMMDKFRNQNGRINLSHDDVDNVVSGNLFLKPTKDNEKKYIEISSNSYANKSRSMPNYYNQQRQAPLKTALTPPLNKYEEYIVKKSNQPATKQRVPPTPPQRKSLKIHNDDENIRNLQKPTNLEDAINELEAIYKSLKLGDEDLLDRAERRDIPTPTNFEKYAVASCDDLDDEDDNTGEPDVVLDDVAYRNLKRSNTMLKTVEPQPPFGIPVAPVPPSPNTDYLHVTPEKDNKKNRCVPHNIPDLVSDDLAVRTLRKDVPGAPKSNFIYPNGSLKKKRAVRSMSANIYNLIQRDAAKPSGGSLYDYYDLDRALEKAGSLTDVRREDNDIPSTLFLIRSIQDEERNQKQRQPSFQHPSQGGAVFNLPSTLNNSPRESPYIVQKPPIPLPRKSISPDLTQCKSGMEEALNQIAKEAKESSEKLSRDLIELRKEALSKSTSPAGSEKPIKQEMQKLDKDIEEVSKAAKICEDLLLNVVPSENDKEEEIPSKPRKLSKEEKLIEDIDQVSEAAKVCEKLLQDVVTTEPPVMVEIAQVVQNKPDVKLEPKEKEEASKSLALPSKEEPLVVATLLEKLDPASDKIGQIAARCMRQISELSDLQDEVVTQPNKEGEEYDGPDYDNLNPDINVAACKDDQGPDYDNLKSDSVVVSGQETTTQEVHTQKVELEEDEEEEIDKIMKECEEQAAEQKNANKYSSEGNRTPDEIDCIDDKTPLTSLSSSDCHKSSSPTPSRHQSSSITSIHAFSSSDYVKSPSSDFHPPSTDPIKTFSTTSYDVDSSSVTPNITNSPLSMTPSPPLALTPIGNEVASPSQYNSSEELAMIFGINPPATATSPVTTGSTVTTTTGNTLTISTACDHSVATTTTTTNSIIATITADQSASPSCDFCDENVNCCYQSPEQHDSNFITIARYTTDDTSRHIRLLPANASTCLDTIPEHMHDDIDSNIILNAIDDIVDDDDDTKTSLSSHDDSGNVSLSDFPVQNPINTSLELSLLHNSQFSYTSNRYPFINQIEIQTTDGEVDDTKKVVEKDPTVDEDSARELRKRLPTDQNLRSCSMSAGCSTPSTTSNTKLLALPDNRQSIIQHIIIACTCSIANNDIFTFLVIVITIITIIAIIIL